MSALLHIKLNLCTAYTDEFAVSAITISYMDIFSKSLVALQCNIWLSCTFVQDYYQYEQQAES